MDKKLKIKMKKLFMVPAAAVLLFACNQTPETDKATIGEAEAASAQVGSAYNVDSSSMITWMGSKPTGTHEGVFQVSDGTLYAKNDSLTGGTFNIDMHSLNNKDLAADPENKAKLEGHLKSGDFFDVEKYPTSKFEITSITKYVADSANPVVLENPTHMIQGNLTLKDSTKNISFPAKVTVDANSINAIADLNIDRTLWGMNYKGPNNPQDWFIKKEVHLKINVLATKK